MLFLNNEDWRLDNVRGDAALKATATSLPDGVRNEADNTIIMNWMQINETDCEGICLDRRMAEGVNGEWWRRKESCGREK